MLAVAALATVTACSGGSTVVATKAAGAVGDVVATTGPQPAGPPARLTVTPRTRSTGVSPAAPVTVRAAGGTLSSVRLVNPAGRQVSGTLSVDRTAWRSSEPLGYSKSYTLTVVATSPAGRATRQVSTFSTVTPDNFTMPSFGALDNGGTFGVGMPITLHFDEAVPDRAAAERALQVDTNPPVTGAWHWIDSQNLHWRPKTAPGHYWRAGTKVTVSANLYGVNLGSGLYGQADRVASFTIGRSQIGIIDNATHMMTIYVDGKAVRKVPVSLGRGGSVTINGRTIDFWTRSGPHVVLEKYQVREMKSESYGIPKDSPLGYDEKIPLAVRISGAGEFIHAASWSVADQGQRNVSHGCVNISPSNAQWFFDTFRYGDIVDVRGTPYKLGITDGLGDWNLSWTDWVKGSALG
ncbi:MAG: L,D-transpeptidase [Actinobacteria bacterium]|nr:L,D-transpeptidase [Actinomycetota bacterium]